MTRWISVGLLTVLLGAAEGAEAQQPANPFPLADGNRWTLRDVRTNAPRTISVTRGRDGMVLTGLPGAPDLRVRRVGETVQAWDIRSGRWEALFRFGAPTGEQYAVDLGDTLLWRSVVVTVAAKRAVVEDHDGRARKGCVRFTFRYRRPLADAGIESIAFARGVGPVRIVDMTIAGTRELALDAYRLR